jgi:hypothetical protein
MNTNATRVAHPRHRSSQRPEQVAVVAGRNTFNSVLLVARPNLRLFRDYDNLWVRVLYWPVIWFTLLVVMLLTFDI